MSVTNIAKRRGTILDEIMAFHRENLPKIKREVPLANVRALAQTAVPPLDFYAALKAPGVSLIGECKKASPAKGVMVPNYDPVQLATAYVKAGACAIAVLTDRRHFQGSLSDLRDVKEAVGRKAPILRQDFIFDPYQVYEARAAGADAILLIAAILSDKDAAELLALTHKLGMNALVEVHTEAELARMLAMEPRLIGINNRNWQTFQVDLENTARLRQMIPDDVVVVGKGGMKTAVDVQQMLKIGVDAILVGETLVKSKDPCQTAKSFVKAGKSS